MKTWVAFKVKKFDGLNNQWITEIIFYLGSENEYKNIKEDWRFCAVKGKRNEAVMLGEVDLTEKNFPIEYPLLLKNGIRLLTAQIVD